MFRGAVINDLKMYADLDSFSLSQMKVQDEIN